MVGADGLGKTRMGRMGLTVVAYVGMDREFLQHHRAGSLYAPGGVSRAMYGLGNIENHDAARGLTPISHFSAGSG